ncbi:MAG: phosphate regulon sensor histidine kinase PhoR [Chromatiales bacterium]|jgi:two-component system phosphate regulon sensor histidine kinase PhoR|nr:MAG: phosphate regulon sensor histidine kinase PhoR [Chromatiales bacterium]
MTQSRWGRLIGGFLLMLALATFAGLVFGGLPWWLLASALALLGWHLFSLYRLDRWLRGNMRSPAPGLRGVWGSIESLVRDLRRRLRHRKAQFRNVSEQFRRSASALPDGVLILDSEHAIQGFNERASQMLDLVRRDRGRRIDNFIRDPEFVNFLKVGDFSQPILTRSRSEPDIHLSCLLVPYGEQQYLMLVRDVTVQTRMERVRRDFVANASHELRSPLTVLNGYLDNMADDPEIQDGWAGPIDEMRRQTTRMTAIISDLLELSRLEAESSRAGQNKVDVAGLLSVIRKDALARENRPEVIEFFLESSQGLLGEERELHSIFNNLVDNALKYTGTSGRVTVRWTVDEEGGHFSVADTGVGIDPDEIPRLTERFYRVDRGRSRLKGGTGLGLSIVKYALQRHQAQLEVTSSPGEGSRFSCHFPPGRLCNPGF